MGHARVLIAPSVLSVVSLALALVTAPRTAVAQTALPPVEIVVGGDVAPVSPLVSVRVRADGGPRLELHRTVATTAFESNGPFGGARASIERFEPVCWTPCRFTIPAGIYSFGVSSSDARAIGFDNPIDLQHDVTFTLRYDSREGLHTAGWLIFGGGVAAGVLLAVVPRVVTGSFGDPAVWSAFGFGIALGSGITGVVLTRLRPQSSIAVSDGETVH